MYDELVNALRETDFSDGCPCGAEPLCKDKDCVILQAADAIEELSRENESLANSVNEASEILRKRWIPVTVRCKDCRWWDQINDGPYGYCHACKHAFYSSSWEINIYRRYKEDWYCADGERKNDEVDNL